MAFLGPDDAQYEIIRSGVVHWNRWRQENPDIQPKLYRADLRNLDLSEANLSGAFLSSAKLDGANLCGASLQEADVTFAKFRGANLTRANFASANLNYAKLEGAVIDGTIFEGAGLRDVKLDQGDQRDPGADARTATAQTGIHKAKNYTIQGLVQIALGVAWVRNEDGRLVILGLVALATGTATLLYQLIKTRRLKRDL